MIVASTISIKRREDPRRATTCWELDRTKPGLTTIELRDAEGNLLAEREINTLRSI